MIRHYYKCFGCGRRHAGEDAARECCCVVQEIFACPDCGDEFPTERKAKEHVDRFYEQFTEARLLHVKECLATNVTNDTNQAADQAQHDFMMGL